ncbi:MAG: L-malate glycosyltransferase [Burkholderiales bacterium]|jgi:glycosyltransferase involved in cell wall biosynthesis
MKILLLSNACNAHTIKWARGLAGQGLNICIFGLEPYHGQYYNAHPAISVVGCDQCVAHGGEGSLSKLRYLAALPKLRKLIDEFRPNILHAHYASSYGLLGALSGFRPFILSVWGSDIFSFPNKSSLHRNILRFNLSKADKVLSTSHVMARETQRYTSQRITVTPFGVDLDEFRERQVDSLFAPGDLVIGTVKALEQAYGIPYLVRAFKVVCSRHPRLPLKLLIVGGGSMRTSLQGLVDELGLRERVTWTGKVPYDEVSRYHNMLSISVFPSNSESFGVAAIEASACGRPVVVSDVGGLPEVVEDGVTGIVVPAKDVRQLAQAIGRLVLDETLRRRMGGAGRERVRERYNWQYSVRQMIGIYEGMVPTRARTLVA